MKVRMLLVAAAVLAFASLSFGQGFLASFTSLYPLTTTCGGSDPVPDGTPVYVYYDGNYATNPGRDAADQLACVCGGACTPDVCHNFNQFGVNGAALGLPGAFVSPDYLTRLTMPSPARYYLVVETGQARWVSTSVLVVVGPQDFYFDQPDWTCEITAVPCNPTPPVFFTPDPDVGPQSQSLCATICRDPGVVHVCVGPVPRTDRIPTISVVPGCAPTATNCDLDCPPAAGFLWDNNSWVWMQHGGANYYCTNIVLGPDGTEGCICITLDFVLPVNMGPVAITPLDNAVSVTWTTLAETGVDKFQIRRDGNVIGEKSATNNPTGAEYSFTDGTAENGRTYEYQLVSIGLDGVSEVHATESVTPSFDNALVTEYALHQNFPNPFNPTTRIAFDVKEDNVVSLSIYNAAGQLVSTLLSNVSYNTGRHSLNFDATNLTSGLYFYTIKIGNEFTATKKMLLVK